MRVAVSILPQAYFVERIGGDHIDIGVLIGPGQSPATYEPTPRQMVELSRAKCLFRMGLPFENRLLEKLGDTHSDLEIIDTRRGIALRQMTGHIHNNSASNAESRDPHIWLNPRMVKVQAQTICDALKRFDPLHSAEYTSNLAEFHADLDALDAKMTTRLARLKGKAFFTFHPSFGYFADAYGLRQVAFEIEGKQPGAKQLTALIRQAKKAGIRGILVQQQFVSNSAKAVAEAIGGKVIVVDPFERDYFVNLSNLVSAIIRSLDPKDGAVTFSAASPYPVAPVSNRCERWVKKPLVRALGCESMPVDRGSHRVS